MFVKICFGGQNARLGELSLFLDLAKLMVFTTDVRSWLKICSQKIWDEQPLEVSATLFQGLLLHVPQPFQDNQTY